MIPELTNDGLLPPGIHDCEWSDFVTRFGKKNERRMELASGLKTALDNLKAAGATQVYIDGSFVTAKETPGDFDVAWDIMGVDASKVDRILLNATKSGRIAQKIKYGGELFPAQFLAAPGRTYLTFFQIDKQSGKSKGIIRLDLSRLS